MISKCIKDGWPSSGDVFSMAVLDGYDVYTVSITVIHNKYIPVVTGVMCGEGSCLIRVYLDVFMK